MSGLEEYVHVLGTKNDFSDFIFGYKEKNQKKILSFRMKNMPIWLGIYTKK